MKYLGLDNRYYPIQASDYTVYEDDSKRKSELHLRARKILKGFFPCDKILEEVSIRGANRNGGILYADFLLPAQSVLVEVHGEQHYSYSKFFHGDKMAFMKAKMRDNDKIEWCNNNNISYIELPFGETDEQWSARIEAR